MNEWLVALGTLAVMVGLVSVWCITEQLCKYGMNCWHRWGKWSDWNSPEHGKVIGQKRYCEKCNLREMR